MKNEMKAEEALVMQEEIVFQKDEFMRDQLNERMGKEQDLQDKQNSITEESRKRL